MLFNSYVFLLVFLPAAIIIYAFADPYPRLRMPVLILLSFIFYGYWDVRFLPILIGSILVNWLAAKYYVATRQGFIITAAIAANLVALGIFKYTNFFAETFTSLTGLPVGLGEPVFGKLKATLSGALASIPAVAAVWVGPHDLMERISMNGSAFHADASAWGGIQGGLSNGSPLELRVWFKPPSTLREHALNGRHDPCVLPRAVPIVEAMVALTLADARLSMLAHPHRA